MSGRGELRPVPPDRGPMDVCFVCSSFVYMVREGSDFRCPRCHCVAGTRPQDRKTGDAA